MQSFFGWLDPSSSLALRRLRFVAVVRLQGGLVSTATSTAPASVMSARRIRVAGSGFKVRVDDQADRFFPSRDTLVRVVEILAPFAVVVMIVVMIGVAGVELTQVALAQRHSGVDHFEIFVVVFIDPAARGRFGVARRPGRTLLAAARTAFGATLARAAATAASTASTARSIFTVAAWFTCVSFGCRSFVGEFSELTIRSLAPFVAKFAYRRFITAAKLGTGIASKITSTIAARRSFAAAAPIAVATTTFAATAITAFTVAAAATILGRFAASSRVDVGWADEFVMWFAV